MYSLVANKRHERCNQGLWLITFTPATTASAPIHRTAAKMRLIASLIITLLRLLPKLHYDHSTSITAR